MRQKILLAGIALLLAACQFLASQVAEKTVHPATVTPAPVVELPPATPLPALTNTPAADVQPTSPPAPNELMWDPAQRFGGITARASWQPQPYSVAGDSLPVNLDAVANPEVTGGLTAGQRGALAQNGFTVLGTGEKQFADIRFSVMEEQGQPYYLTTDAAYHALHVTFDELLKALEREVLRPRMVELTSSLLEQVLAYQASGAAVDEDARLAAAYLAVALRLFDDQAQLPEAVEAQIEAQLAQIEAAAGREQSALIPGFEDDYGAYKPVGHYAGDPALESYFRGMTWYGRVSFPLKDVRGTGAPISKAPLIITLALRQAEGAAQSWKVVNKALDFIVGPTDDAGPAELSALMEQVYGPGALISDLADEQKWQQFLALADALPAPQIHSTFLDTTAQQEASRDWRLMGQRFTFDAAIFQNLIYDKVGTPENKRVFPTGPDVMAVLGSPAAQAYLEASGETDYANYTTQMDMLQQAASEQTEEQWLGRFYTGWLYSFIAQVAPKDATFPPYLRTEAWAYKELNSAPGSWAELKHDTVLYGKMPEFLGGGGPPSSPPPPSAVEPNPEVFYRLAYIAQELHDGITLRLTMGDFSSLPEGIGLAQAVPSLAHLARQFQALGDIAVKELSGQPLSQEDFFQIEECLGIVECKADAYPETPPVPVVAAVSGAESEVLEAGVGYIDRMYVATTINGQLVVAQGGVFSYYEQRRSRSERLTDEEWRAQLESSPPPRPAWTEAFLLPGGETVFAPFIRVDDWYIVTEAGGNPPLNVRAEPSRSAGLVGKLPSGTYLHIIDGPQTADGLRWWKVQADFDAITGWIAENAEWIERAHGQ